MTEQETLALELRAVKAEFEALEKEFEVHRLIGLLAECTHDVHVNIERLQLHSGYDRLIEQKQGLLGRIDAAIVKARAR